jgi:hypothetical protein
MVCFFFLQIILLLQLENITLLSIPWIIPYRYILSTILFPPCYIFVREQKKVHNLPLIVSYSPISDIQANRFCFIGC